MSLIIAGFLASVAAGATDWRSSSRVHSVGKSTTIQNPTPAVLVFEDSQYQELLSAAIAPAQLDVIDCSDLTKYSTCGLFHCFTCPATGDVQ